MGVVRVQQGSSVTCVAEYLVVDTLDSAIPASWLELAFGAPELASFKPTFVLESQRWSVNFLSKEIVFRRRTAIFGWLQRKKKKSNKIQSSEDDLRMLTESLKDLVTEVSTSESEK